MIQYKTYRPSSNPEVMQIKQMKSLAPQKHIKPTKIDIFGHLADSPFISHTGWKYTENSLTVGLGGELVPITTRHDKNIY